MDRLTLSWEEVTWLVSLAASSRPDPNSTPDEVMRVWHKINALPDGPFRLKVTR